MLAKASELFVEVGFGEAEHGGTAVGTVVCIVDEMSLGEEGLNFVVGETLPGFDGGFAGHGMEEVVDKVAGFKFPIGVTQGFDEVFEELFEIDSTQEHGVAGHGDHVSSEVFDAKPQFGESEGVVEKELVFLRAEDDSRRDKQTLRFHFSGEDTFAETFVENAFVKGVLVDDGQSITCGNDEIAVIDLKSRGSLTGERS